MRPSPNDRLEARQSVGTVQPGSPLKPSDGGATTGRSGRTTSGAWNGKTGDSGIAVAGPLIRAYREQLGWTQAALAARANVSADTVRRLEGGACRRPLVGTLVRISGALHCELADLLWEASGGAGWIPPQLPPIPRSVSRLPPGR